MDINQGSQKRSHPEFETFIRDLLRNAASLRAPELFTGQHADALYQVRNRHGISVVALRTTSLNQNEIVTIMRYRLAQYVAINFVDAEMVYDARMEHEPLSNVSADEVHILAGSAESGEILCYACFKGSVKAPVGTILADAARSLFPVEQIFGRGIYNRLKILPDLPVARIRELGRLVKNQGKDPLDEFVFRATVEVVFTTFQLVVGPLRAEIDAVIGDFEEGVAKKNMDFFHVPVVVIHGVIPYVSKEAYMRSHVEASSIYPFALLVSDLTGAMNRLAAIEQALNLPGKQGIMALLTLKSDLLSTKSSLEPLGGLPPLTDVRVPQQDVAMQTRRQLLDVGDWLRTTNLFSGLSVAEAAVLSTFMERRYAVAGEAIIREGEIGDEIYMIEGGTAEVWVGRQTGKPSLVNRLGPGDYFGEIALITAGKRTADVIALTPMTLMRLTKNDYSRYLAHLLDIESQLTRTAITRTYRT